MNRRILAAITALTLVPGLALAGGAPEKEATKDTGKDKRVIIMKHGMHKHRASEPDGVLDDVREKMERKERRKRLQRKYGDNKWEKVSK